MKLPLRPRSRWLPTSVAAFLLALATSAFAAEPNPQVASDSDSATAAPTSRAVATRIVSDGTISAAALAQIQALDQEKSSRTPAQKKIASALLYTLRMNAGLEAAPGVPTLDTGIAVSAAGKSFVNVRGEVTEDFLALIRAAGGDIVSSHDFAKSVHAWLPLSSLESLVADSRVLAIRVPAQPMTHREAAPARPVSTTDRQASALSALVNAYEAGQIKGQAEPDASAIAGIRSAIAKGDIRHGARRARAVFGVDGTGLKIGVMSNSFNAAGGYAADIVSGDLPGSGNPNGYTLPVLFAGSGDFAATGSGADEGRAMTQIVHSVLPGAQIYFATAFNSDSDFANNIRALRGIATSAPPNGNVPNGGCDIIVDDVSYSGESALHDGQKNLTTAQNTALIKQAVNDVVANGCLYFSSAGNAGNKDAGTAGAWEGDFNPGGVSAAPFPTGGILHNWVPAPGTPNTLNTLTTTGRWIDLEWADTLGTASVDYDLYVLNAAGTAVLGSSTDVQDGTGLQDPYEGVFGTTANATGNRIAILAKSAVPTIRFLTLTSSRGVLQFSTDGQTRGHASAPGAFATAAVPVDSTGVTYPQPFASSNVVETFSSDGFRRVFYGETNNVLGNGALTVAASGGIVRIKPDITGADGAPSTVNTGGLNPFFGTSAAAPHAAAISGLVRAALIKQGTNNPTVAAVRTILTNTAIDIQATGADRNSGAGILNAFAAVQATGLTGGAGFDLGTITATEATGNGNGIVEPGETGSIVVPLSNVGLATAYGITATLSTTTPGVTVLSGTRTYPDTAASTSSNTNVPFSFALSSNFACTGTINFKLTVSFTGGGGGVAPQSLYFSVPAGPPTTVSFTSNLDTSAAPVGGPGYTATTGLQPNGRLASGRTIATCTAPGTNTLNNTIPGPRRYDAYTFQNNGPARCISVTFSAPLTNGAADPNNGSSMVCAAYSVYTPATPDTGYLGDLGGYYVSTSVPLAGQIVFSFNAPANAPFTIVVVERNPGIAGTTSTDFNVYGVQVSNLNATCAAVNASQVDVSDIAPVVVTSTSFVAATCAAQGYATDILVNATVTNTSSSTMQGVNFQVAQLSNTSGGAGTPPYRLLTATGASCTAGGGVGSIQPLANPGTLAPGATANLQFRVAAPTMGRFRFGVRTFANSPSFGMIAPAGAPAVAVANPALKPATFEIDPLSPPPAAPAVAPARAKAVKVARASERPASVRR